MLCHDGERKRGSSCCTFWWEQPLSIDIVESLPGDEEDEGDDTYFVWTTCMGSPYGNHY